LRFGFENITVVDGDKVELSNLNCQNYTEAEIGKYKAEILAEKLRNINSQANISFHNIFIDRDNVEELLKGHDIAVNALEFKSDIPFVFDGVCKKHGITVLHPYNFG
jgi:tRNA A37 threonylcarbamoyladenosine dehydratase